MKLRGTFAKLLAPGLRQVMVQSLRVHPGAVLPVSEQEIQELLKMLEFYPPEPKPLPPGVPLDEDIFNGILQHLWWFEHEKAYAVYQITEQSLDMLYMEAVWRKIKSKK